MKLNTRNNIVLISLVLFQAFLAYNFLTFSLGNFSQREGAAIIDNDVVTIRNHYDKLKNSMWKDVVHLDNRLPELLYEAAPGGLEAILPLVMNLTNSEDLDYIIVEHNGRRAGLRIKQPFSPIPYEKLPFDEGLWHPKVTLQTRDSYLYMIGSLQVPASDSSSQPYIINVIRQINDRFTKDLTYNTSAGIILYSGETAYAGTLDPDYYFPKLIHLNKTEPEAGDGGTAKTVKTGEQAGFTESRYYDQAFYGKSYNMSITTLDTLSEHATRVQLALFSPNLSIKERVASIKRQFLLISILCVLLAMGFSLIISRSISLPVKRLGKAMASLTQGQYPVVEPQNMAAEITKLYSDFNSMAARIQYNASQQIAMIQEITFLKNYNEQIVESIQEGIAIIDKTGHLNLMNRAFYTFCPNLQSAEIPHTQLIELWDTTLQENLEKIRSGEQKSFSYTSRDKAGNLFDIRLYPLKNSEYDRSTDGSTILMLEDITAKAKLESQLLQIEKLNSLSILTAGVAHEINNPLASILANVENLHIQEDDKESQMSLVWIKKEIGRIAAIIKSLFSFTGNTQEETPYADGSIGSGDWSDRINMYMKYALKNKVGITFINHCSTLQPALCIPDDQLLQVLINLLNNAVGAIERTGNIILSSEEILQENKPYLKIQVADDGPGIPQEILHKIFDPFYTTKPVGKGTGLGLSIVYGLIQRYGGDITIETEEHKGTTFFITIPYKKGLQHGKK